MDCATDRFARVETLAARPGPVDRSIEIGNRLFVEAVIWKFCSAAPWRDLPALTTNRNFRGGGKSIHLRH